MFKGKRKFIFIPIIILILFGSIFLIKSKLMRVTPEKLVNNYSEKLSKSKSISINKSMTVTLISKINNKEYSSEINISEELNTFKNNVHIIENINIQKDDIEKIEELSFEEFYKKKNSDKQYFNINNKWYNFESSEKENISSQLIDYINKKDLKLSDNLENRSMVECYKVSSTIPLNKVISNISDLNILSIDKNINVPINYYFNKDNLDLYEIEIITDKEIPETSSNDNQKFTIKGLNIIINNIELDKINSLVLPEDAKSSEKIETKEDIINLIKGIEKKEEMKEEKITYLKWKDEYKTIEIDKSKLEMNKSKVYDLIYHSKFEFDDNSKKESDILKGKEQDYLYGKIDNASIELTVVNPNNYNIKISNSIIKEILISPLDEESTIGIFNNIELKYSSSSSDQLKKLLGKISYEESNETGKTYFWTTKDYSYELSLYVDNEEKLTAFKITNYQ